MGQCPMASSPAHAPGVHDSRPTGSVQRRKDPRRPNAPALLRRRAPPTRSAPESLPYARPGELPQKPRSGSEGSGGRYVLLKTGMRNIRHSGLLRAARCAGPGSRRRRNAERVTVGPPDATIGYLPQEPERRPDETVRQFRARRTGVGRGGRRRDAGRRGRAGGRDVGRGRGLLPRAKALARARRRPGRAGRRGRDRAGPDRGVPRRTGRRAAARQSGLRKYAGTRAAFQARTAPSGSGWKRESRTPDATGE